MKKNLRFSLLVVLVLSLLAVAFPAAAEAPKTEFTGTLSLVFIGDVDPWYTGNVVGHGRNQLYKWTLATTFPALNGWAIGSVNFEQHYPDGELKLVHVWGKINISTDEAGQDVQWVCSWNGFIYDDFSSVSNFQCQGVGENEGLVAKISGYTPIVMLPDIDLQGVVLPTR